MYLFIIFVILPIAEIGLLIEVGDRIGTLNTVGFVVLTALIGSLMLRHQGLSTLFRARARIEGGELPLEEMLEGICLAVGGALLVTPGFITDIIGFTCLVPGTRRWLVNIIKRKVTLHAVSSVQETHVDDINSSFYQDSVDQETVRRNTKQGTVIEGEFQRDKNQDK